MIQKTARTAIPILFIMLIAATTSVRSCPTCLGRVTKTSPAFFKNIIYKDPSVKTDRSSIESIGKQSKVLQALTIKHNNQKI